MWSKIKRTIFHKKEKKNKTIYKILGIRVFTIKKSKPYTTNFVTFLKNKNKFYTENPLFINEVPQLPSFFYNKTPQALTVKKGIVLPPINAENKSYKGGVVTPDFNFIKESGRYRDLKQTRMENTCFDSYRPERIEFIDEKVIYAGDLINHWGHFLVEGTVRLWYPLEHISDTKIVYTLYNSATLERNILEFLFLCGFKKENIYFLRKPTQFKEVIIPEVSSIFLNYYTDKFMLPFHFLINKVPAEKIDKIYFSRGKFQLRPIVGEDKLEKLFSSLGYKIFYPERLSLFKMIALLKGAKLVAGLTGTGIHNILFANPNVCLIALVRAKEKGLNNIKAQLEINEAKGIQAVFLDAYFDFLSSSTGPYLIGITPQICRFLSDKKVVDVTPSYFSKREVKKFIRLWLKEYFPYDIVK